MPLLSEETAFVERAVRQASAFKGPPKGIPSIGDTIHHLRPRFTATLHSHFGETLMTEGLKPSIGSVGDAFDNALAETTIGLYKTECIRDDSPFRRGQIATLADLDGITSAWVHWYNTSRLMHRHRQRPPAEVEAEYYSQDHHDQTVVHT